MSRIGNRPVALPAGVEVTVDANNLVTVKGPKGQLQEQVSKLISVEVKENEILFTRPSDAREYRSQHGLARTLVNNRVVGVTEGYLTKLQLSGVGYSAENNGDTLVMNRGRNMRFSVTVVFGDGNGYVGVCLGKAQEIPEAVRKATEDAKKNLIYVPTVGTTIPHRNVGIFGAGKVLLMPAAQGTGVIAGSSVRTVLEAAGIKDVRAKSIGSSNTGNMAYATLEGLKSLMTVEKVAKLRGKAPEEILG